MAVSRTETLMRSTFDRKNNGEGVVVGRYTVAVLLPGRGTADWKNVEMNTVAAMEVAQIADWEAGGVGMIEEAAVAHKSAETIVVKSNAGQPTGVRHNAVMQNGSSCTEKPAEQASTQAPGGGEVHVPEPQHVQELV
jgi:hypothetical protein